MHPGLTHAGIEAPAAPSEEIVDRLRGFLLEQFPAAASRGLALGDPLIGSGIVDSMGVLEIVGFIEREFGIRMSDDDLLADTFETVAALARFVEERLRGD